MFGVTALSTPMVFNGPNTETGMRTSFPTDASKTRIQCNKEQQQQVRQCFPRTVVDMIEKRERERESANTRVLEMCCGRSTPKSDRVGTNVARRFSVQTCQNVELKRLDPISVHLTVMLNSRNQICSLFVPMKPKKSAGVLEEPRCETVA